MKPISKTNLAEIYARIPYEKFTKAMKDIGFTGTDKEFDKAYISIGGKMPVKEVKESKVKD